MTNRQVVVSVPVISSLPLVQRRWNTNEEVAGILLSAQNHPEWIVDSVVERPVNGSLLMYNRKISNFKRDGYIWRRRRDSRMPREDHMKLKVNGVEVISANYVHSSLLPTFHRRSYCLLSNPDLVLVHYLNVPNPVTDLELASRLIANSCQCDTLSKTELSQQLTPMLGTMNDRHKAQLDAVIEQCCVIGPSGTVPQQLSVDLAAILTAAAASDMTIVDSTITFRQVPRSNSRGYGESTSSQSSALSTLLASTSTVTPHDAVFAVRKQLSGRSDSSDDVFVVSPAFSGSLEPFTDTYDAGSDNELNLKNYAKCVMPSLIPLQPIDGDLKSASPLPMNAMFEADHHIAATVEVRSELNIDTVDAGFIPNLGLSNEDINQTLTANLPSAEGTNGYAQCVSNGHDSQAELGDEGDLFDVFASVLRSPDDHDADVELVSGSPRSAGEPAIVSDASFLSSSSSDAPDIFGRHFSNASDFSATSAAAQHTLMNALNATASQHVAGTACNMLPQGMRRNAVTAITEYSPDWSYPEGGTKVLISGPWYSSQIDYCCMFDGTNIVAATLVQTGVLKCYSPAHAPGVVTLEVGCDGSIISSPVDFTYKAQPARRASAAASHSWLQATDTQLLCGLFEQFQQLADRLGSQNPGPLVNGHSTVDQEECNQNCSWEDRFLFLVDKLSQFALPMSDCLDCALHHSAGLLHFAAALGFTKLILRLLQWRHQHHSLFLDMRLDGLARDEDGRTPLMWACARNHLTTAQLLLTHNRDALFSTDNMQRLPLVVAYQAGYFDLVRALVHAYLQSSQHPTTPQLHTALWVLTSGQVDCTHLFDAPGAVRSAPRPQHPCLRKYNTVDLPVCRSVPPPVTVRPHGFARTKRASVEDLQDVWLEQIAAVVGDDEQDQQSPPLAKVTRQQGWEFSECEHCAARFPSIVSSDLHLSGSDSTDMQDMFEKVTKAAKGAEADEARHQIASLAQQIIDALPARIKDDEAFYDREDCHLCSTDLLEHADAMNANLRHSSVSNPGSSHSSGLGPMRRSHPPVQGGSTHHHGRRCSDAILDQTCLMSVSELGEFFQGGGGDPAIEASFQKLTLSDHEQRELYEAARVIQNAFRQYKARLRSQRQQELERQAAVVIQSYYRRYKQYVYFKRIHHAAVLIQKHFRMYRAKRQLCRMCDAQTNSCTTQATVGQFERGYRVRASVRGPSAHDVSHDELHLWKEHLAALRIQHAFRGHCQRKRQAAAKKIQKFMKLSRHKLQVARGSTEYADAAQNVAK